MKVTIQGQASFPKGEGDDMDDVDVEIVGHPDEELKHWEILLVHPKFSLKLRTRDVERALRPFVERQR